MDQPLNKQRKLQEIQKPLEEAAAIEIGENAVDGTESEIKFKPKPPATVKPPPSPIGRKHTRGAYSAQVSVKGKFFSFEKNSINKVSL